nr:hypothetical protein [Tanacetum cinerariifolium]
KKIYKPTNNNLRTSSNTSRANQDNSPRVHRNAGYESQRNGNVAGARDTVGSMVQKSEIQYYNCKEYGHVARECQKLKRAKDAAYHREKMLLIPQLDHNKLLPRTEEKLLSTLYNPSMIKNLLWFDENDETSKDKEIDKLMALISLSFKKIYKPTNNNLRTSLNTSRVNQDNSPRINRNAGHVTRECQKPKRAKDAAYHREKMLPCKQEEAGIQLNAEQADWKDDTNDELVDQELEAHYMYMAQLQQVSPDAADSRPIFDDEPLQKVSNNDHYNVFAIESTHPEQSKSVHDTYPIEQDAQNVII